jgi:hypothetical protein
MIYKGIEFTLVQDIEARWKWSVLTDDNETMGDAKNKPDAVIAAWQAIDRALRRKTRGLAMPGVVAGQTKT